jgi:4-phosphopantoate--beta-alanine ligase
MPSEKPVKKDYTIPSSHPRYKSLQLREAIVDGVEHNITAPEGLIAHGRGEAFDYIIGECTTEPARNAIEAAAAALILAENPVLSVNGNVAALVSKYMVELAKIVPAKLEVCIFHFSQDRFNNIIKKLKDDSADEVLGDNRDKLIPGLDHARAACTNEGIYSADVVLVPLEDGDRAKALRKMGKLVISIDLNPLSRTAKVSNITIVDNLVRAVPKLVETVLKLKKYDKTKLGSIKNSFDNTKNLKQMLNLINSRLDTLEF